MIPIGKVSHVTGLSIKAIKFYEERGLISPSRQENQYRMYGMKEIRRLSEIKQLRQIGLSMEQIQSGQSIETLLESRLEEIQHEMTRLQQIEAHIRLMQTGGKEMNIRYETLTEPIPVHGYWSRLDDIPRVWSRLQPELTTEVSYGVCLAQEEGYVAGMTQPVSGEDARLVELTEGNYIVATVEGGIPMIAPTYEQLLAIPDITLRDAVDFERYVYGQEDAELLIEVWMPIE